MDKKELIKLVEEEWKKGEIDIEKNEVICVKHNSSVEYIQRVNFMRQFYFTCVTFPCKEYELKDGKFSLIRNNKNNHFDPSKWDLTQVNKFE